MSSVYKVNAGHTPVMLRNNPNPSNVQTDRAVTV